MFEKVENFEDAVNNAELDNLRSELSDLLIYSGNLYPTLSALEYLANLEGKTLEDYELTNETIDEIVHISKFKNMLKLTTAMQALINVAVLYIGYYSYTIGNNLSAVALGVPSLVSLLITPYSYYVASKAFKDKEGFIEAIKSERGYKYFKKYGINAVKEFISNPGEIFMPKEVAYAFVTSTFYNAGAIESFSSGNHLLGGFLSLLGLGQIAYISYNYFKRRKRMKEFEGD